MIRWLSSDSGLRYLAPIAVTALASGPHQWGSWNPGCGRTDFPEENSFPLQLSIYLRTDTSVFRSIEEKGDGTHLFPTSLRFQQLQWCISERESVCVARIDWFLEEEDSTCRDPDQAYTMTKYVNDHVSQPRRPGDRCWADTCHRTQVPPGDVMHPEKTAAPELPTLTLLNGLTRHHTVI